MVLAIKKPEPSRIERTPVIVSVAILASLLVTYRLLEAREWFGNGWIFLVEESGAIALFGDMFEELVEFLIAVDILFAEPVYGHLVETDGRDWIAISIGILRGNPGNLDPPLDTKIG